MPRIEMTLSEQEIINRNLQLRAATLAARVERQEKKLQRELQREAVASLKAKWGRRR